MKNRLIKILEDLVTEKFPSFSFAKNWIEVTVPADDFGDYSTNLAFKLARKLKQKPFQLAEEIKKELDKINEKQKLFEKIELAGPGFLNFYFIFSVRAEILEKILKEKNQFGSAEWGKGRKIHLDFVSANPTGPIHLGNSRGGPLGDVLANILQKVGFEVFREYYVNDFGNQIKILGHSILKDEKAQYKGDYIDNLQKEIKETEPFKAGRKGAEIILQKLIQPTLEKMGIIFDRYFLESSLHQMGAVEAVFKKLTEKNFLYEKEGALWFRASKFGDEKDRVVKKTTGEITYFGGDIVYHYDKLKERNFDLAIDIWGADHHGDVARVKGAMEALGLKNRVEIILTQNLTVLKNGQEFKMSKRKGQYICLDDLVEEVGRDAVRFIFLSYSADSPMIFNIDLAKEKSNKNPVYYVQYASARMAGILAKTQELNEKDADFSLLNNQKEKELIKHLMNFPDLILEIAQTKEVHRLTHYAIRLADKFHSFYQECRILNEEKNLASARRELVKASKIVLTETLRILGVTAPEKM